MINDFAGVVRNATCLLFADDLKLLTAIKVVVRAFKATVRENQVVYQI